MRTLSPLLAVLLFSCDEPAPDLSDEPTEDATDGTDPEPVTLDGHRWSEAAGTLDLDADLASNEVSTSEQGPWAIRSAGSSFGRGGFGSTGGRAFKGGSALTPDAAAPMMEGVASFEESVGGASGSSDLDFDSRQAPANGLKAGATDDNRHFDDYVAFLAEQEGRFGADALSLDVRGRRTIQALSPDGSPLPGARVSVVHPVTDALVWTALTQGDGRAPFYPNLTVDGYAAAGSAPEGGFIVQVEKDGAYETVRWDGRSTELDVTVDAEAAPPAVDVCFIIDTTGSMGDEIARIKQTLLSVTDKLRGDGDVDLRYGAVLYRDIGDEYVTKTHAFTTDIAGFDQALQGIQAAGGGDGPESMNQGLALAVGDMAWREDSARVAFLIADAPPHMDYQGDVSYGRSAIAAIHHGVRIHTVAASGLDDRGSLVFRQVAQLSGGEFIFIEYGSVAASAADHGVTAPVSSNNLDDILYQRIHDEIVGWGVEDGALASR